MKTVIFIVILVVLLSEISSIPSIYIEEPHNAAIYISKNENGALVPLKYQLFDCPNASDYQLCFSLFSNENGIYLIDNQCASDQVLDLNNVPVGTYILTSYLRLTAKSSFRSVDNLEQTKINTYFTVRSYFESLPTISLKQEQFVYVANYHTKTADVSIPYKLLDSSHNSRQDFSICIKILESVTQEKMIDLKCFETTLNVFQLKNLKEGSYIVSLLLKDLNSNTDSTKGLIEKSEVTTSLQILPLSQMLPQIILLVYSTEYVTDVHTKSVDVPLKFSLTGVETAVSQVQVCIEVDLITLNSAEEEEKKSLLPLTCLPPDHRDISLSKLGAGKYNVKLVLRSIMEDETVFPVSEIFARFEIRNPVEFIPSYNWQPLRVWHTIPGGIETRLPLSDWGHKEARIPNPWRLQLSLPYPCKYFLRMDIYRNTRIIEISTEAGKLCHYPKDCFFIKSGDLTLAEEDTVEDCNYFNIEKSIEFDADCLPTMIN